MHPWLTEHLSAYGVCVLVGVVLAWLIARWSARTIGMDASRIDLLLPLVTATGIAGAYVPASLGGAAGTVLLGALLAGTGAGILYAVASGIGLGDLGDVTAGAIAVGVACGRVGCFLAGCCYGIACPLGVTFPRDSFAWQSQVTAGKLPWNSDASLPVHPVQLYEAAACVLIAVMVLRSLRSRQVSGERFLWLGIMYGTARFGLEFLRADDPAAAGWLTVSQTACVAIVAVTAGTWILRRRYAETWKLKNLSRTFIF